MSYQELPTDDQIDATDDLWGVNGFEVKEMFMNEVPHVMGELVKKPSGESTEGWVLL